MNRALRELAQQLRAATVGAVHVTCADESMREAAASFQHWFKEIAHRVARQEHHDAQSPPTAGP